MTACGMPLKIGNLALHQNIVQRRIGLQQVFDVIIQFRDRDDPLLFLSRPVGLIRHHGSL